MPQLAERTHVNQRRPASIARRPQSAPAPFPRTATQLQARDGAPVVARVTSPVSKRVNAGPAAKFSNGGGLPPRLRANLEALSGFAMNDVRVHRNSSEPAKLGALAFTRGAEIHLAPGQEEHLPHEAWHVVQQKQGRVNATTQMKDAQLNDDVGLEAEADRMGRKAVETCGKLESRRSFAHKPVHALLTPGQHPVIQRQPQPSGNILSPTAATAAAADVTSRFGVDSIRALEFIATRPSDGVFDVSDAEAVAKLQRQISQRPTGKVDVPLLNAMLSVVGPTAAARSALIHLVIDHANLNVSAAIAVVHDPSLTTASARQTFPGGVSIIQIGNAGFANYGVMVRQIRSQLAARPTASPVTPVPAAVLTDATSQQVAISLNKNTLTEQRSIRLLQGALGSRVTGSWDVDLVRHIAAKQQTLGLSLSGGILWDSTFAAVAGEMIANGSRNEVLHLIVDYYKLDRSHAFNIVFDPNPPNSIAEAETLNLGGIGTPGVVRIFPKAFAQPFANLVHNVAHELGHIQQFIGGIASLNVREFLSEGIEIESDRMPAESIESDTDIDLMIRGQVPVKPGLIQDAHRMLHFWGLMTASERQTHHQRFKDLRTIIINRIANEGSTTQKTKLAPLTPLLNGADAGVP